VLQTIKQHPLWLSCLSLLLFTLGWNIQSFPVFIFTAFAPLLALLDINEAKSKIERIVFGVVTLGVVFSRPFTFENLVGAVFFGALIALLYKGFLITQTTSPGVKKITLLIAILALEYGLLNFQFPKEPVFIADAFVLVTNWTRWNAYTGYLGLSCWVLIINLFFYKGFFEKSQLHRPSVLIGALLTAIPIYFSYSLNTSSITRTDMEQLYLSSGYLVSNTYTQQGEWVARTATWLSLLMVIFTLVTIRIKR